MDTVIDQVHRRASILGPLLWGSSLPTTGNEGYEGIEYFFLLLWGKEFFFLLLWGKNWKGSNDLTAPLWSCMLYLWPQVRSFYSWSLGGISLGGWKLLFPSLEIIAFHSSGVTKSFPPYLTLGWVGEWLFWEDLEMLSDFLIPSRRRGLKMSRNISKSSKNSHSPTNPSVK